MLKAILARIRAKPFVLSPVEGKPTVDLTRATFTACHNADGWVTMVETGDTIYVFPAARYNAAIGPIKEAMASGEMCPCGPGSSSEMDAKSTFAFVGPEGVIGHGARAHLPHHGDCLLMPRHVWQEAHRVHQDHVVSLKTETHVVDATMLLEADVVNFGVTDLVAVQLTLALTVLMSIGLKKAQIGTRKSRHVRMVGQRRRDTELSRFAGIASLSMPPKQHRVAPFTLWHDLSTIPGDSGIVGFSDHKINVMHVGSAAQPGKNECLDLVEIFRPYPSLSIVSAARRAESPFTERNLEFEYYSPDDVDASVRQRVQDGFDDCYVFVSDHEEAVVISIGGQTSRISREMWDAITPGGRSCFKTDYDEYSECESARESSRPDVLNLAEPQGLPNCRQGPNETSPGAMLEMRQLMQSLVSRLASVEAKLSQTSDNSTKSSVAPVVTAGTKAMGKSQRKRGNKKKECHSPPQELPGVGKPPVPPRRKLGGTVPLGLELQQDFPPSV